MSLFNKIKFKSFLFSSLLSLVITATVYLLFHFNFENSMSFEKTIFLFSILLLISFTLIILYIKYFISKKITNILELLIPKKEISEEKLISTNMEDLVEQLKTLNNDGWVNLIVARRKEASETGVTHYSYVDTWKPTKKKAVEVGSEEDLPF